MNKSNFKVVTIGGGSGMPVVNKALVKSQIGWVNSIVTVFDSGGDTGRQRTGKRDKQSGRVVWRFGNG